MAQYQHMESALIHGGIYGDKTTGAAGARPEYRMGVLPYRQPDARSPRSADC